MINLFHTYVSELPAELLESTYRSAYYSFFVSLVISRSARTAVYSAAAAATASTIASLITPLFNRYFGHQDNEGYHLSWKAITVIQLSGLGIMYLLLRTVDAYQIHFFASAFFTLLAIDVSCSQPGFNSTKEGPIFIVA